MNLTFQELNELFEETIYNINQAEGTVIDSDEAEELRAEALADYNDLVAELVGVDEDLYEDEYEYEDELVGSYGSSNSHIANFSAGNTFGANVLELISQEYETLEDGLEDIAEATGHDPDTIADLIQGLYAPDDELAQTLSELFDITSEDENAYEAFMLSAGEAQLDVLEAEGLLTEDEDEYEDEDEEDESEFDTEELEEDEDVEASYRLAELEDRLANFEIASEVKLTLSDLERRANEGVDSKWLTPHQYDVIMGNFADADERLAAFSQVCAANNASPDVQLYAIKYALDLAEAAGPVADFSTYVNQPLNPREASRQKELELQALRNFQLMKDEN